MARSKTEEKKEKKVMEYHGGNGKRWFDAFQRVEFVSAALCQDVDSAVAGDRVVCESLDESAPADAIYLVEVSLEEIVESRAVDLVDVSLDEPLEQLSIDRRERDRFAANKRTARR